MKKALISLLIILLFSLSGCSEHTTKTSTKDNETTSESITEKESTNEEANVMYIHVNDKVLKVNLSSNSSSEALINLLKEWDILVDMSDYGNFEKVGSLGHTLPRNDERITTEPGDVILYQGTEITIYYDTNTWNFTRLGKIENITQNELKEILGSGDVSIRISLNK